MTILLISTAGLMNGQRGISPALLKVTLNTRRHSLRKENDNFPSAERKEVCQAITKAFNVFLFVSVSVFALFISVSSLLPPA
jgi:hypothetical protein